MSDYLPLLLTKSYDCKDKQIKISRKIELLLEILADVASSDSSARLRAGGRLGLCACSSSGCARVAGALIVLQCGREVSLNRTDTIGVAGVCAEEFALLCPALGLRHLLPEVYGIARVIACHGHEDKPHLIGFVLLLAPEGEHHTYLSS